MYIIPAIDILNKKVVRLREGDYDQVTSYDVTLEEMIEKYQSNGTNFIHVIDLNGAKNDFSNQEYLFNVIRKTDMKVQYGGGIRSIEKVKELIRCRYPPRYCRYTSYHQPQLFSRFGKAFAGTDGYADHIVVAIDVLDEVIKYSGWMESSPIKLMDYVDKCLSLRLLPFPVY
jgi:phosphoribosylformimino-5-aminoimidazole carboxamide ribotide isomerase